MLTYTMLSNTNLLAKVKYYNENTLIAMGVAIVVLCLLSLFLLFKWLRRRSDCNFYDSEYIKQRDKVDKLEIEAISYKNTINTLRNSIDKLNLELFNCNKQKEILSNKLSKINAEDLEKTIIYTKSKLEEKDAIITSLEYKITRLEAAKKAAETRKKNKLKKLKENS